MSMQTHDQHSNEHREGRSDETALDKIIDAGLVTFPVEPLSQGFSRRLMKTIEAESSTDATRLSPLSYLSFSNLLWFGQTLYREVRSVRAQVRSTDVTIAALFALLWCVVAGSSIWTERLVPWQASSMENGIQLTWLIPLFTVLGGFLTLGMLGIFLYLEQRDY